MQELEVVYLPISALREYERNARKHEKKDVGAIIASIREFGFLDPIGIWGEDNTIVEGHGRLLAARELDMETVPCIRLDSLTDEQRRAYALAHNKTAELSGWDFDVLNTEIFDISNIDMAALGFHAIDEHGDWFQERERWDASKQEENDAYNQFVEKFEPKKTTDDCYTPDNVYEAVAGWVVKEYGVSRSSFVRPFFPGGDYAAEKYPDGAIVVDNPPFSILHEIVRFYVDRGIAFFLFAPTLTLFCTDMDEVCNVCANGEIRYENGAVVNTGFKTNLERGLAVRTAPELTEAIRIANKENTACDKNVPKYVYPANVITAAKVSNWGKALIDYKVPRDSVCKISALDAQKEKNVSFFGGGFLLSDAEAAKAAKASKAAKAANAANAAKAAKVEIVWKLSEREREIVKQLGTAKG